MNSFDGASQNLLIMGVGNLLMGDEGVGIHAVQRLGRFELPERVEVLDGGTGGFHLLSFLQSYPVIIMVDATMDEKAPGTVSVIQPKFASDYPKALSAHDIGLKDLIESAALLGELPKVHLITVTIDKIQQAQVELSPEIENAVPIVLEKILELVKAILVEKELKEFNPN
ncbi:MAG: hydrogenase maturation protease [Bacteroidetes bacterium]|nr:hydrogenase maturation protease [Bacteroidota bacterium]MCL5737143.1 hydrogenase maturation protease [Bacteroidota bacterium]